MVGHGGSSAGSYLANPTSPIPSHCASIVTTSTLSIKTMLYFKKTMVCFSHYTSVNARGEYRYGAEAGAINGSDRYHAGKQGQGQNDDLSKQDERY